MRFATLEALGLFAHAVHLGLILFGLVGVVLLLLPGWRASRAARHGSGAWQAPATLSEHERRVAALRHSVEAGATAGSPPDECVPVAAQEPGATTTRSPPRPPANDRSPQMQWWMLGAVSNGVIAVAYFMISFVITRGLLKGGQLGSNRLGAATAAIFLSCAVHHGAHMVHMLMPYTGVDLHQGLAMRQAWGPQLAFWDLVSAVIAVYYWTLRGGFGSVGASPQLFADQHEREQRALELNDAVLQGMVVARMSFDLNEPQRAMNALDGSIAAASKMITELIGDERGHLANRPLRSTPALVPQAETRPAQPTSEVPEVPTGPAP